MWAHWLLETCHRSKLNQTTGELSAFAESNYRKWQCDPWTWIENIQDEVRKQQEQYFKSQNPIEPLFAQGHYRDNSTTRTNGNYETSNFHLLDELARSVGIPLLLGSSFISVNLLTGTAEKLVLSGGIDVELWNYTLAIRAASSEESLSIQGVFTRIGVARASPTIVDTLVSRILLAIGYWREKRSHGTTDQQGHALSALRVLMEVLARLVVRVSVEKAKQIFRLSVSLGQQENLQHHWLCDAINSLLTNSLKSIPESEQGELLPDALAFPLLSELNIGNFPHWPNPIIYNPPSERKFDSNIDNRIKALIDSVCAESLVVKPVINTANWLPEIQHNLDKETREQIEQNSMQLPYCTQALERLLPLHTSHYLTPEESDKLADKIWGSQISQQGLPNTGLLPHALLLLSAPDIEHVKVLVRLYLYEHGEEVLIDTQKEIRSYPSPEIRRAVMIYNGMANAAVNETTRLYPTPEQALKLFDRLVVWRPQLVRDSFWADAGNIERTKLAESIGNALSYAIAPVLSNGEKTVERFKQLEQFYEEIEAALSVIPAFVYFVPTSGDIAATVEKVIRKSLQGCDNRKVGYAAIALQKWIEQPESTDSKQLDSLISRLIVIIETGRTIGLSVLFEVAGELIKKQRLTEEQVAILIEAIPNAFNAANYANIAPNSREAISASSIREACVKLAKVLVIRHPNNSALLDLLEEAKTDALPEVRFVFESQ